MATLNLEILEAARSDGLLPKRLTARQKIYLHPSVLRANEIYWLIAQDEGLDFTQLEKLTGLHENTLKQFCRWMIDCELLYNEESEAARKYILFTTKHHKVIKAK